MSAAHDRIAAYSRMERTVKTARSYLKKASAYLIGRPATTLSSTYWDLLDTSLDTALAIVEALPDDFFEATEVEDFFGLGYGGKHNTSDDYLEAAQKVVAAFERRRGDASRRRRIEALENVEGRTPQERESYLAKAAELREAGSCAR